MSPGSLKLVLICKVQENLRLEKSDSHINVFPTTVPTALLCVDYTDCPMCRHLYTSLGSKKGLVLENIRSAAIHMLARNLYVLKVVVRK